MLPVNIGLFNYIPPITQMEWGKVMASYVYEQVHYDVIQHRDGEFWIRKWVWPTLTPQISQHATLDEAMGHLREDIFKFRLRMLL